MLKTYCSKCGSANDYVSSKPKFCGSCGKSLSLETIAAQIVKPLIKQVTAHSQITKRFDTDGVEYRHLDVNDDDSFKFEPIEIEDDRRVVTVGQTAVGKKVNSPNRNTSSAPIDTKQFMDSFRASASSSKQPIDIGDE